LAATTAIRRILQDAVTEHEPFFDLLCHDRMPVQIASILLRASGIPRMNFLCRVVAPSLMRDAAAAFDRRVLDTAMRFLQTDPAHLSDEARLQLSLPIRLGGARLGTAERTSPFAFWGGLSQAAPYLATALPGGNIAADSPLALAVTEAATLIRAAAPEASQMSLLPPPDQLLSLPNFFSIGGGGAADAAHKQRTLFFLNI
jgi:hypothetical protein